ncbi:O-methyltransferase family 2 [Fusarium mundagurra]|uniref:O-methyltransferase family 2 n=1 Tax=Fusarium mundagurra TaxID=1567541 RepID=A0A8H6CZT6_9HYPO|nr:O-methyltransferase family 2 [Fusarium mundagurra]
MEDLFPKNADGKLLRQRTAHSLIEQMGFVVANPTEFLGNDHQLRYKLLQQAKSLAVALEEPFETLQRLAFAPLPLITTRIAQERGIFATIAQASGPVSFDDLQKISGLGTSVLASIMNYLCTQETAEEPAQGLYVASRLTPYMASPLFVDAVLHYHDSILPSMAALNGVLRDPNEALTSFNVGHGTDEGFYKWVESRPALHGAFHRFMDAQFSGLPSWLAVIDPMSEFFLNLDSNEIAFVDVGGGNGQQAMALLNACPQLKGHVIVQDRPDVLAKSPFVSGIEKMAYDYLSEQPVKGARIYYFRQIMHNNDDATCLRILRSHVLAMGQKSVIVIDEKALPDYAPKGNPATEYTAALSLLMKAVFNAQERHERHWRELLNQVGLIVRGIRRFTKFDDAAIIVSKMTS